MAKSHLNRSSGWGWEERHVDSSEDHFELHFSSAEPFDSSNWVLICRVDRPIKKVFGVEFIMDRAVPASADMIKAVIEELNFYLVDKDESDPWAYAQYHCTTASNLYSSVHWSFYAGEKSKRSAG